MCRPVAVVIAVVMAVATNAATPKAIGAWSPYLTAAPATTPASTAVTSETVRMMRPRTVIRADFDLWRSLAALAFNSDLLLLLVEKGRDPEPPLCVPSRG